MNKTKLLLKAAKKVEEWDIDGIEDKELKEAHLSLRAAIAKAEGK